VFVRTGASPCKDDAVRQNRVEPPALTFGGGPVFGWLLLRGVWREERRRPVPLGKALAAGALDSIKNGPRPPSRQTASIGMTRKSGHGLAYMPQGLGVRGISTKFNIETRNGSRTYRRPDRADPRWRASPEAVLGDWIAVPVLS